MGQRLNIEIVENNKVVANAYYHWSAYTLPAFNLADRVLTQWNQMEADAKVYHSVEKAVHLLQATGATLPEEERRYLEEHVPSLTAVFDSPRANRTTGLIAVSPDGIRETEEADEGRVSINLSTQEIVFDVIFWYEDDHFKEEYEEVDLSTLPVHAGINLVKFNFDEFPDRLALMNQLTQEGHDMLRDPDENGVYVFIS